MNKTIVKGSNINPKNIEITQNSKNKSPILKYNSRSLIVQTPIMSLPWNLNCYQNNYKDDYSISMSFKGMENDEELSNFYNKLLDIDKKIIKHVFKNSKQYFNKVIDIDLLEKLYYPIIRLSIDKETKEPDNKYPPTINIKIPYRNNAFELVVFNSDKEKMDLKKIPLASILVKEIEIKALIQLSNIWIMDNKFGCSLKAVQIVLTENKKSIPNYSFIQNNSDESDDEFDIESDDY